jgi:hypothetical protein
MGAPAPPAPKDFRKSLAKFFEEFCARATCRPAGWVALWRRMGAFSVLDSKGYAFP